MHHVSLISSRSASASIRTLPISTCPPCCSRCSVSSLVANGYGGQLTDKQLNAVTWAFTGASLGNAKSIAPSYGATELLISLLMTIFLFWAETALYNDAHRVEQKQVTAADYGVMVSGLPRDLTAGPIETALAAAPEVAHLHVADHGIVVPLHQRELILQQRELASNGAKREAYAADIDALTVAKQKLGSLSPEGAQRLEKLKTALTQADGARQKLLDGARDIVTGKYDAEGPRCAGVAFITFEDAHDALSLLEQGPSRCRRLDRHPSRWRGRPSHRTSSGRI